MNVLPALAAATILLSGCGGPQTGVDAMQMREVTMPGGQVIQAEVMMRQDDMARGMMHRSEIPSGRGLLFVFGKPGQNRFWMLNVKVPLDIVWMDRGHTIVELAANAEPCPELPCRSYGGEKESQFILELAGGSIAKYGLQPGQTIRF